MKKRTWRNKSGNCALRDVGVKSNCIPRGAGCKTPCESVERNKVTEMGEKGEHKGDGEKRGREKGQWGTRTRKKCSNSPVVRFFYAHRDAVVRVVATHKDCTHSVQ